MPNIPKDVPAYIALLRSATERSSIEPKAGRMLQFRNTHSPASVGIFYRGYTAETKTAVRLVADSLATQGIRFSGASLPDWHLAPVETLSTIRAPTPIMRGDNPRGTAPPLYLVRVRWI
jgi:hypothetical protein